MREEIWTEKIFKDDAGYFLKITILYFLRKISSIDFYLKNIKREGRGIAKARNLFVEISFWEMISSLKFPP